MKSVKRFDYTRKDLIELHKIAIGCFIISAVLNKMLVCYEKHTLIFAALVSIGLCVYAACR